MSADMSGPQRQQIDTRFGSVLSEVDTIADTTSFNGVALLRGGSGPGGVLEISFQVAVREITLAIPPARVANLSPGLARGSVRSDEGARVARWNIAAAARAVDLIRAGIAADRRRVAAAYRIAQSFRRAAGDSAETLTSPTTAVDLSRVLAMRIAEEGGIAVADRALDRFRQLLIGLDHQTDGDAASGVRERARY